MGLFSQPNVDQLLAIYQLSSVMKYKEDLFLIHSVESM